MTHSAAEHEEIVPSFEASELIEYGKIEEITQSGNVNNVNQDSGSYS